MEALTHCAGLLLAAGYSSRMGALKPLLRLHGRTLLEHATASLFHGGVRDVYVVLGHRAAEIEADYAYRGQVRVVYNASYDDGMFSSIQAGLRAVLAADAGYDAFFMLPGDHPFIEPGLLAALDTAARDSGRGIVIPRYRGRNGHPCRISLRYAAEIAENEFSQGMKTLFALHRDDILYLPTELPDILFDLDRPEDYQQALRRTATKEERQECTPD